MIEIVETTIGFMFESLADSATPVCSVCADLKVAH